MKIPIFVSCPTDLNSKQQNSRIKIIREISKLGMEPRALGRSDYPTELPLREVFVIAKHCAGGVILGFEQLWVETGKIKRDIKGLTSIISKPFAIPSPWNQLEAGILFSLDIPLLIFKEKTITGGVFDNGVTDVFIHKMPMGDLNRNQVQELKEVFLKWQAKVRQFYYKL